MERETHSADQQVDSINSDSSDETAQETAVKGDKGALWLLVGVVVLAGGTLWMIRDIWTSKPVAVQAEAPVNNQTTQAAGKMPLPQSQLNDRTAEETSTGKANAAQDAFDALRRQKEESLLEAKKQAALNDEQRREAEQQLEQERSARVELEKQHLEAEKKLAEERAALEQARLTAQKQLEAERVALEKARLAAEKKLAGERAARQALEEQRRAAEQKLARERSERAALERRAALEKQKLFDAQQEAIQLERERALAEQAMQAEQNRLKEAAANATTATPQQVTAQATQNAAGESATGPEDADKAVGSMDSKFSSNPCDGPSAKFLSTCR